MTKSIIYFVYITKAWNYNFHVKENLVFEFVGNLILKQVNFKYHVRAGGSSKFGLGSTSRPCKPIREALMVWGIYIEFDGYILC